MIDGIYEINFRGAADWGMGMLIFKDGTITGADGGGVLYDGTYSDQDDNIAVEITLKVPPGVPLVQGTPPQSKEYSFAINVAINKQAFEDRQVVRIEFPPGPVNVIFNRLREL